MGSIKDNFFYRRIRWVYGKIMKVWTLKLLYPHNYKKYAKRPLKEKKVIFAEIRVKPLSNNYIRLYEKLKDEYHMDVKIHYLENTSGNHWQRMKRNLTLIRDMADARYIFVDDGFQPTSSVKLRPESQLIQIWHACGAFKKFGFSTADLLFGANRYNQIHYPTHANYTLAPVSSREVVWAYEEAFGYKDKPGVVQPLGTSRTDAYFDERVIREARAHIEEYFPQSKGKKIILYAPTFRGRVLEAETADKMDVPMMMRELSDEYVLLMRHHFLVKNVPEIPEECRNFAVDCSKDLTIEECLIVSDVCITDYSSLIFEYALFERPMLFFAYDIDDYNDWRGFYYSYEDFTPGPVCRENEELIRHIKALDREFDIERVRAFRDKFMGACDGHATDRIIECILGQPSAK